MAVQGEDVYVIEVNPRASRTVPFVSKCIGVSLAKVAARCMAGTSLDSQGVTSELIPPHYSVKESVFPFAKFPGVDPILGPEMKSTGEVMGTGDSFDEAFAKAHIAAGDRLPSIARRLFQFGTQTNREQDSSRGNLLKWGLNWLQPVVLVNI